jgi:hypothetical protein
MLLAMRKCYTFIRYICPCGGGVDEELGSGLLICFVRAYVTGADQLL